MLKIEGFVECQKLEGVTDIILHVSLSDDFYKENDLNVEEYPKDAWNLWVTQEEEDRETCSVWVDLCNEGMSTDFVLDENEHNSVVRYLKNNKLDEKYGLIIK